MSKNRELPPQQPPAAQPPASPQEPREPRPPVPAGLIWTFWGGVLAVLVAARILVATLPNVPDHVIERWVMLAFAVFLAAFLAKLK
jgi:hypothetical protein